MWALPAIRQRKRGLGPLPKAPAKIKPPDEQKKLEALAPIVIAGTLPERILYNWLVKEEHSFVMQRKEFGGRDMPGGAIADFVVYSLHFRPVALRIMGDYWHGPNFPDTQARDDAQSARMRARGYIVVDLIESEIYNAALRDRLGEYIWDCIASA